MVFEIILTVIIFALVPLAIKETVANPFTIGFFRLAVASVLVGLYWRQKINWKAFKEASFWKLLIIGVAFFGHWITYTFSVKVGGPSVCVLGMATYSIQLIFYGSWFLGHKIKTKNIFCLVMSLIGLGLVIPNWNLHNDGTLGLVLALISASFYSIIPIMLQKSHEFSQETRIFFQFSIACLGYIFFLGESSWVGLARYDWGILLFLAVLGTFVAHSLWSKAVTKLPTTTSGIIYYIITPLTMVLSWGFLGEKLSNLQKLGGLVILVAALINIVSKEKLNSIFKLKRA